MSIIKTQVTTSKCVGCNFDGKSVELDYLNMYSLSIFHFMYVGLGLHVFCVLLALMHYQPLHFVINVI